MTHLLNIAWALAFSVLGAAAGCWLLVRFSTRIPAVFDKITPDLDEGKEILRGNRAVSDYFGRVVAAAILGVSIIIAAAVAAGIMAGLHG
jgi:uncharacterized membrane protein YjfL (UPF0719 family)